MREEKINILLAKFFRNECNEEETATLKAYLRNEDISDAIFEQAMDSIENEEYLDYQQYSDVRFDKSKVLEGIKEKLNISESHHVVSSYDVIGKKPKSLFNLLRIAASISIIAVTSWFINSRLQEERKTQEVVTDTWVEKETLRGQIRSISLPDGSKIKMNVATKIRFFKDFMNQNRRLVYLDGEAFFDVAKMKNKPFVIIAKGKETMVLGTSFNIEAYKESPDFKLAVVTGKVKVRELEGKDMLYLKPNEMATWGDIKIEKSAYDHDVVLGWTKRSLVFKNANLETIIAELEKWYDVDINVAGNIKGTDYTAIHKNQSLEVLLEGLAFAADFRYKIEGKKVTIYAN